jgi:hypothetical protein
VGIQLENAEVGPTSGPTWRLSHLLIDDAEAAWVLDVADGRGPARRDAPLKGKIHRVGPNFGPTLRLE